MTSVHDRWCASQPFHCMGCIMSEKRGTPGSGFGWLLAATVVFYGSVALITCVFKIAAYF